MQIRVFIAIMLSLVALVSTAFAWTYWGHYGDYHDECRDVALCSDGGFFFTGRSYAWAAGDYDWEVFLTKIDAMGNEEWVKHYGQIGVGYYDAGWSVYATPDTGCIIAGKTQSPMYCPYPYWDNLLLVRVDKNGDTLWTRSHGEYYFDRAWCIIPIPGTDEFYLAGCTHSYGPGTPDEYQSNMWVLHIDSAGNVLYQNAWGNLLPGTSDSRWCCLAHDDGVVIVGNTADHDTTYEEEDSTITRRICKAVAVKYDAQCNQVWEKVFDRGYFHYSRSITQTPDGCYLISTYDKDPSWTWVLKLDENGDTLWTTYVGTDSTGEERIANFTMVVQGPDSGFYFAGSGAGMARILYTDKNCDEIWQAEYDYGPKTENFLSCKMTPDSGCVAGGVTYSRYPYSYMDVYAVRVDRWGHDVTEFFRLSGWAFNAITHEPIEGVTIYDTSHTYYSTSLDDDSVGIFYFDDIPDDGGYVFIAEKDGYITDTAAVEISYLVHQDFYLTPSAMFSVDGIVSDTSGTPIADAAVSAVSAMETVIDTVDASGNFSMSVTGLVPVYFVASAEGYRPDTVLISLRSDTTVDFSLTVPSGIEDKTERIGQLSITCSPNPFNSSCRISLNGISDSPIDDMNLKIYDLRGNLCAEFNDNARIKASKRTEWTWNPQNDIGSGIYFVRAALNGKSIERKIIYIK